MFDPELIELFETFFGSLPGSYKPELFNFQPKSVDSSSSELIDVEKTDLQGLGTSSDDQKAF